MPHLFFEHFIEFVEFIIPPEDEPAVIVIGHHHLVHLQNQNNLRIDTQQKYTAIANNMK